LVRELAAVPPQSTQPDGSGGKDDAQVPQEAVAHLDVWTAEILDDIEQFVSRFVVYPSEHERRAHVLWIAHAWLMDRWDSTPRIAFLSPEPGSGKSRALEVMDSLVPRPVHAVNTTPAYLFRKVADPDGLPTILYDEVDTLFGPKAKDHEEIRGMINAGHRKGATAGRCVVRGKEVFTEELPAYCAVALAGLDDLPDTIMSRSVVVRMRKRSPDEVVESWRLRTIGAEADALKTRLEEWSAAAGKALVGDFWPEMPHGVEDRDADVWEALLAVADLAGGRWSNAARVTAVTLVTASRRRPPSIGVLLLGDIKKVFDDSKSDKLSAKEIIEKLVAMPESPWKTIRNGEPIDDRGLSPRLRKYDIASKSHRVGKAVFKGYSLAQFADAWKRYVDDLVDIDDDQAGDCGTDGHPEGASSVTPVTSDTGAHLLASDATGTNNSNGQRGFGRAVCRECERAPARADTGTCDFCTVKSHSADVCPACGYWPLRDGACDKCVFKAAS
jgi:hypothetical protein